MDMHTTTAADSIADHIAPISRQIWDAKYRLKAADGTPVDLTIEDSWRRVAAALAAAEADPARWEQPFYEALQDFRFLPAGRILSGAGADRRVTLFNCFVMGDIADDLGSIFSHLREAALTMQQGGGIGYDFSTLRPKGAAVKGVGADASGPLSFMDVWDAMCRTIMSAGARRGAMMATMRCDHPDIEDFIAAKRQAGRLRNFNLSVLATDPFMAAVEADAAWPLVFGGQVFKTIGARALFDAITRATYDYAEPGVIFIDRINKRNNLYYCEQIHSTNPCVTGDTRLATQHGMVPIAELVAFGTDLAVTVDRRALGTGTRGVEVRPAKPAFLTASRADVFRVTTRSGHEIKATAWHDFLTPSGKVKLKDLAVGDTLLLQSGKGQFGKEGSGDLGTLLGMITGDGHFTNRGKGTTAAVVSLWGDDKILKERLVATINTLVAAAGLGQRVYRVGAVEVSDRNMIFIRSTILARVLAHYGFTPLTKLKVPEVVWRGTEACVKGYLRALFQCDGTVNVSSNSLSCSVRLSSSHRPLLQDVQVLLGNLGILSRLHQRREAGVREMPDGKGSSKEYQTVTSYELIVDGESREAFMAEVGFMTPAKCDKYRSWVSGRVLFKTQKFESKIVAIEYAGQQPVFDTTQPDGNTVIFNGIATGQCGEQPLPPYGACLLGSINLPRLVQHPFTPQARLDEAQLDALVGVAVRMMDNTIDVSGFPLEAQRQEAVAKRRIGLGMTGLADALMMCGVRYGSDEAAALAGDWARRINRAAYVTSAGLAGEKGAFPLFDREPYLAGETVRELDADVRALIAEHGIRNALLTSVAPTGTISLVADNVSSGIEPVFALAYTRKVLQPDGTRTEEEVSDHALRRFRAQFGEAAALPAHFVTAQDLTPAEHVRMQAAVQRHVDSAISKTVNVPEDISFEAFQAVYLDAYRSGCKGCTTYRPNAITGSVLEVKPAEPPRPAAPNVIELARRAEKLTGVTYKLRWPDTEHAMYVTINDVEIEGRRTPFEIFVNSKNLEHYAWVVALTRMISAVFRRGGEVAFVAEELKQVFDPRGGQWSNGHYVPSLVAAIGDIIERHMLETGFLAPREPVAVKVFEPGNRAQASALCPKCSQPGLLREAGCLTCLHCGWSRCS